jgi:Cobalamin-independent synthase, N-terminal domain
VDLTTYFRMARGKVGTRGEGHSDHAAAALEMTKWFDTNNHYLVPEFDSHSSFRLATRKPIEEFREARALGGFYRNQCDRSSNISAAGKTSWWRQPVSFGRAAPSGLLRGARAAGSGGSRVGTVR